MRMLVKAGEWTKSFAFVMNNPWLRKLLRRAGVYVSGKLHPNGVIKNVGGVGNFLMSPEFTFYNFGEWGSGKNNGFRKLIELAKGKSVAFDVGAHIGICSLPISRVLLEAMDIVIPVIETEVGGIPEVIDKEVNGLLVPYGDKFALKEAILRVLNDGVLKLTIINAGFYTLQSKFNSKCHSKELESIYDSFT